MQTLYNADLLVCSNGQDRALFDDLEKFLKNEKTYAKYNLTYKRGYLLVGPPGTGKTSLIKAAASKFDLPIYNLQFFKNMGDSDFADLLRSIRGPAICAIEDIDSIWEGRNLNPNCQAEVTFKGFINSIDGLCAANGVIYFITTNKFEAVDEAVYRPGRMDRIFQIDHINHFERMRLLEGYYEGDAPDAVKVGMVERFPAAELAKPAAVQEFILSTLEI